MRRICKPSWLCLCLSYDVYFFYLVNAFVLGISNVKSREDLVMSGSDSSDPFEKAPFKKPGTMLNLHLHLKSTFVIRQFLFLYHWL